MRFGPNIGFIAARFSFTTESQPTAKCSGLIRLAPGQDGQWRIWVLSTILEEIEGFGNPDVLDVSASPRNGLDQLRLSNGIENHANGNTEANGPVPNGRNSKKRHFSCIVVGGGMAGQSLAGDLKPSLCTSRRTCNSLVSPPSPWSSIAQHVCHSKSLVLALTTANLAILPIAWYCHFFDSLYNATSNTETSDCESFSPPNSITHIQAVAGTRAISPTHSEQFDALDRVGFKTDRYPDMYQIILKRQGGHYLDVGVSQKIADGLIKVKSDAKVV